MDQKSEKNIVDYYYLEIQLVRLHNYRKVIHMSSEI